MVVDMTGAFIHISPGDTQSTRIRLVHEFLQGCVSVGSRNNLPAQTVVP